jgi:hypothetical protein
MLDCFVVDVTKLQLCFLFFKHGIRTASRGDCWPVN